MKIDAVSADQAFLAGGGKLAELIAAFDWSATPLGPLSQWTATLKTTVGLMLRSPVPIVTMWGPEGIMVYNDGYAQIAGGRHPELLGSPVRDAWPEVREFNDHVMNVVFGRGDALAYADQEMSLNRNGAPEQVWFNLDYSPIPDETGRPVGVIAFVVETTGKVRAERWVADDRTRMRQMFEQAPGFMAMLRGPEHIFDLTNAAYMQLVGHRDVLGKTVREALPEIEGQGFFELLDNVYTKGEPFIGYGLKVAVQRTPGAAPEERFVDLIYQPVRNPTGEVEGIFVEGADVTERLVAERALRESEAQFRLFAEAMPNHFWTAPPDGRLDWFNTRVYDFSGATPGELDGHGWAQLVHPDDLPAAGAAWAHSLATGEPYEVEFRLRRHDGAYRWHIARAVPIRDSDGNLIRWIGTNTDIDEQKRISHELRESDARLRLAIEAGQLAIWEMDVPTRRITPSPAMNRLYGFPEDASPSAEEYATRYAPGEQERLAALSAEARARGDTNIEVEARHLWPDGTEKWLLIRAEVVDGGRRALGVVIDITGRKRAQEELAQSEQRLRLSQEAAGIGSLEVDIASGTVIGSDRLWELWGLPPAESVPISVLENIVIPEDRHIRSSPESRRTGTATPNVQYRIRRPDNGELRWLSRHVEFVHDAAGKPVKMFGVMRDITEEKEAQSRQQMLTHELEHRIKNILAMVSAIASQTLRNSDLETASATFLQRLKALANAHDILTRTRWTEASLAQVVESAIAGFPREKIAVSGPHVSLQPKMALSLALAIHELGTNSLKYGALSSDAGRIELAWSTSGNGETAPTLTWLWRESGGPPVTPPTRRGFGRFLIERVLATDFQGSVRIDYPPQGVECLLTAPLPGNSMSTIAA